MLQITFKTLDFKKIMVYKTPPEGGGGGKPYLARGLDLFILPARFLFHNISAIRELFFFCRLQHKKPAIF